MSAISAENIGTCRYIGNQSRQTLLISFIQISLRMAPQLQTKANVRETLDRNALDRTERLVAELGAIERWDAERWQNTGQFDMAAFKARQKRRSEILSELLTLVSRRFRKEDKNQ